MIHYIFPYGSFVYDTKSSESDLDLIVVADSPSDWNKSLEGLVRHKFALSTSTKLDISFYALGEFKEGLLTHEISFLECFFLPKTMPLLFKGLPSFELSLSKLRESVSRKASNSWVRAKKKLVIAEDYDDYIARKSLFHSLRILSYGQQIAQLGSIVDYTASNEYWLEIKDLSADWELWNSRFKKTYNAESTKFKCLAPKE